MLVRYLKAQVMVLLCGGLVGPIFLAVYFYTGQDELMKWMFWTGLLVTAIDVLVALGLAGFGQMRSAEREELEVSGILGLAEVTGIGETGTRVNDQPLVKLNLHITGPQLAPFDAQDKVLASVSRLPMITARKLVVMVNPATNKFHIDWERSALVSGMMPVRLTSEQDGRTYDLTGRSGPIMDILQILKSNGVALSGIADLRSNPVVRQQVMDVVRRATAAERAPAPAPAAMAPPVAPPAPSTAQRLQEIETLRAMGTISEAEYTAKRAQIIAEL
ncbi:SHOCT domain-containing protein [Mycolicibacterium mucogenicum]|uniref:SHOCT domain-containing protein n=1 Tax=Mycolicibacterium mucogenicum DSM 44124 TaxID=1226753 RepID=A0A8H2JI51_MYCMU|nr:SHOCT domain-containing protein [Mycolicibacterium mucogenicum]KAB7755588.1 membrane protein [Mycolicibacterium mucogenicum DSM 44124]QPG72554.1 SHOCT domain-containing protein [Mycolicibacterium mucogenicum DSM 44124]